MIPSVHFPSKDMIRVYLANHRLTKNLFEQEKKIIDAVSVFFANQRQTASKIESNVRLAMIDLKERLDFSETLLMDIEPLIALALMECAQHFDAKL